MNRPARVAVAAIALAVALATPAVAHVTVNPSEATQGGYTKLTFRVPNERDDAATVSVSVSFPKENPVSVSVRPLPGWKAEVTDRTVGGETSTATITWTGGRIEPGEFQEFEVSGGPLPEADELVLPAVQTYDDGEVVRWIEIAEEGGSEPEHPAPVLHLVKAAEGEDEHGAGAAASAVVDDDDDDDDDGGTVGVIALVVAVLAAGLAAAGIVLGRRRPS